MTVPFLSHCAQLASVIYIRLAECSPHKFKKTMFSVGEAASDPAHGFLDFETNIPYMVIKVSFVIDIYAKVFDNIFLSIKSSFSEVI